MQVRVDIDGQGNRRVKLPASAANAIKRCTSVISAGALCCKDAEQTLDGLQRFLSRIDDEGWYSPAQENCFSSTLPTEVDSQQCEGSTEESMDCSEGPATAPVGSGAEAATDTF